MATIIQQNRTLNNVAEQANLTPELVQAVLQGIIRPDLDIAYQISKALGTPLDALLNPVTHATGAFRNASAQIETKNEV